MFGDGGTVLFVRYDGFIPLVDGFMTAASPFRVSKDRLLLWQPASWDDYVCARDAYQSLETPRVKLFFYEDALLVDDMGWEGINHAIVRELFGYILLFGLSELPESATSMGGCLFEKDGRGAGSPDLVVYVGDDYPQWSEGESRKIDLNRWRVPDLVGEISDTTLASDLDKKKRLYATLGIEEYWVIDVAGRRAFLFCLDDGGQYQEVAESKILTGATRDLFRQTILKLKTMSNMQAANWFRDQLVSSQT